MRPLRALLGAALVSGPLLAQDPQSGVVAPVCVQGIGECRNVAGLRLAFRDRALERVVGVNITAWMPHKPTTGVITGLAIGLPSTGSEYISGIAVAPALLTARTRLSGLGVSGIGVAVSGEARAIVLSGVGTAIGEGLTGIAASGIGVAVGGDAAGIIATGLGSAVAGEFRGIALSGFGVALNGGGAGVLVTGLGGAVGQSFTGIAAAGLGFGGGGSMTGITVAGLGAGLGGDLRGISIAGLGAGVGGRLTGLAIAGLGVGAGDAQAIVIAPVYFRARRSGSDATARGVFVSAVNDIRGEQTGLSIGVINFARSLRGVQLGVINIVADGRSPRMLPIVNWR